ncbi:MAG: TetR family transcriptional regulator C-terminal domain-containing protein [Dongiaceae bacterium]
MELIQAAVDTMAVHGFERLTMARVAKAAKVSPAELRDYFHDRKDLLAETLRTLALKYEGCWRDKVHRAAAPIEKLKAMIEADFDPMVFNRAGGTVWYGFWREAQWRPECRQICLRLSNAYFEQARAIVQEIADQGRHRNMDVPGLTRAFNAMIDGLWMDYLINPESCTQETANRTCHAFLAVAFPLEYAESKLSSAA